MSRKRGRKKNNRRTSLPNERNITDERLLDSKLWFSTLNSLVRHMIENQEEDRFERDGEYDSRIDSPVYFGYSISLGHSGVPLVRELGSRRPEGKKNGHESSDYAVQEPRAKRQPTPVSETILDKKRGKLRVIVDLPGLSKTEDIRVLPKGRSLKIRAKDELRSYNFSVPLKRSIHNSPMSVEKTSYNNGILEVTLKLPQ
ncbi:MAG: Hsp20/alpha crystallin family protein [Nitrososphaerota archaeon]|nr:Hsp20/alpha crystallin family protein [Nitrososphaerota archaeon]